jgi:hypothetical protein
MAGGEARFYLELAESLSMTRAELLSRMSSAELTQWIVLWKLRSQEREAARASSGGRRGRRR